MLIDPPLYDPTPMTSDRFCELVNGPLAPPLTSMIILRLVQALWFVLNCTGARGAAALEAHCTARDEQDRFHDCHPDDLGDLPEPGNTDPVPR